MRDGLARCLPTLLYEYLLELLHVHMISNYKSTISVQSSIDFLNSRLDGIDSVDSVNSDSIDSDKLFCLRIC